MRKRDLLLIIIILILAGAVWLIFGILLAKPGGRLRISVNNQEYAVYDLHEDQTIVIGDTNVCQIEDGVVTMVQADCPDQVCVHSMGISRNGQTIICMPNKVVLEITDGNINQIDTMVE